MSFEEAINSGFSITAEVPPPKGADATKMLDIAKAITPKVAGINVTDNQRGMARMSAVAFASMLAQNGCEPVLQLCCRDRNRLALHSDMLGAYGFGVRNLLLMTGDHPTMGDTPEAKPVYDLDAIQLMELASGLNDGYGVNGKKLKNHPDFYIGGVVNPFFEPFELELLKIRKKMKAGARFFQTQPFFDIDSLTQFIEAVKGIDAKFIVGVTPIKNGKMARFMNENVLTTPIPEELITRIESADDPAEEGLKVAAEFVKSIRGVADGVHLMPVGQIDALPRFLEMIDG